jgi:homoserine O-succinyltransferase
MPIIIPEKLPGRATLEAERVPIIPQPKALRQDIRPLQIAILNLMPDKIRTETQLLRAIGNTPIQLEITLLHAGTHQSKNTAADHLTAFYQTHADVKNKKFDGLIVTGAPIEHLEFEQVTYWDELKTIFEWSETNVHSRFYICWGAQAALYHHHGINKRPLPAKQSGIYRHKVTRPFLPLTTGFDNFFNVPVSRNTDINPDEIKHVKSMEILVESDQAGVCLVHEPLHRRIYMFNHLEYDPETLKREYDRDVAAGLNPAIPVNYFPKNDPANPPDITWRAHRHLLFSNWINMIYKETPYELEQIGL